MQTFKRETFTPIEKNLIEALIKAINKDRNKEQVDRETIRGIIQSYKDMGLKKPTTEMQAGSPQWSGEKNLTMYVEQFQQPFLAATTTEYRKKASMWISTSNAPEYLKTVTASLALEEANADFWLEASSKDQCLTIVVRELITGQAEAVVDKDTGCDFMFTHAKLNELGMMYACFKRDEGSLRHIINKMNPYIVARGE